MVDTHPLLTRLKTAMPERGIWWHWTALQQESVFRYFLEKIKPRVALEIGTFQGLTAALLAEYAEKVITIDCVPYTLQEEVWQVCGCREKIQNYVFKSSIRKKAFIDSIEFDLAYIDGSHMMENLVADYEMTKRCGRLLFHDYWQNNEDWQDVKEFVDTLKPPAEVRVPFAYWRAQ